MTDITVPDWKIRENERKIRNELEWQEEEILKSIQNIGTRLKEIHDKKLYQLDYPSFEAYCSDRWQMSRVRGYQLIAAENTRASLSDMAKGDDRLEKAVNDLKESQLRAVAQIESPEKQLEVVKKANDIPGRTTQKRLMEVAAEVGAIPASKLPSPKQATVKEIKKCPHCGEEL